MPQPMTHDEEIEHVHLYVAEFKDRYAERIVNDFPSLRARLSRIGSLVDAIDLKHLSNVPIQSLAEFRKIIQGATKCITDYMTQSYPADLKVVQGVVPPQQLSRSSENIRNWEARLEEIYANLYALTARIITHQQARLARVAFASRLEIDTSRCDLISANDDVVWRYMPLENLIRCEAALGIWFSSLAKLKTWSERGIVDTHEGEVPPLIENLKRDYNLALIGSTNATEQFCNRYGIPVSDLAELDRILKFTSEPQNLFVSSWSRKRQESSSMWSHYGDGGRGIAIRSRIGKLVEANWKIAVDWSGITGPQRFSGLLFRSVKYLNFDASDRVQSVHDLYLPFLKRAEFEDEHEVRILGFTNVPAEAQGITLHCNLVDVVEEIVVGPHADLDQVKRSIQSYAADLVNVPIRNSSLSV